MPRLDKTRHIGAIALGLIAAGGVTFPETIATVKNSSGSSGLYDWVVTGPNTNNAIVRVSWPGREVRAYPLPEGTPYANLNTCAFDGEGNLWFMTENGVDRVRETRLSVQEMPTGSTDFSITAGACSRGSGSSIA